jgi:two-component system LytT family response regulator
VAVVGEAGDGAEAVRLIAAARPDVVFLDVQMPGMSGLDVAAALDAARSPPLVVFVTAYDRYAIQAFEVSACDYLLKPFDAARLDATVRRVVARLRDAAGPDAAELRELLRTLSAEPAPLALRVEDRHVFVDPRDIEWIEMDGKEARVHLVAGRGAPLVVREPMRRLEARLDASTFLRVHRSAIVNRHHVREMQPWFKGEQVLVLRGGARVITGPTYGDAVTRLLAGRSAPRR